MMIPEKVDIDVDWRSFQSRSWR